MKVLVIENDRGIVEATSIFNDLADIEGSSPIRACGNINSITLMKGEFRCHPQNNRTH